MAVHNTGFYPPPQWIFPSIPESSEIESIEFDKTELVIENGESYQLHFSFYPEDSTADFSLQSSNDGIITVDSNGMITAKRTGDATVTVSVTNNPSINAVCNITVVDIYLQEGEKLPDELKAKNLETAETLSIAGTLTDDDFYTLSTMDLLQHLDISKVSNEEIPQQAFQYANFSTIELPEKLKSIGQWAFLESYITELDIPDGVTEIQNSAFMNCYKLKKLTIPGSVETVGGWIIQSFDADSWAFPDDIEMVEVIIEEGVTSLSQSTFYGSAIKSIDLPSTITEIPDWCFESSLLESIELDGITSLGQGAFWGSALKTVKIPSAVTVIPDKCFAESKLSTIEFHNGITRIGGEAFNNCPLSFENNTLVIPRDVEIIGPRAFALDNSQIEDRNVKLNEKLVYLYQDTFNTGFQFDTLELPASLKYLSREAFNTTDGIQYVVFNGTEPPKVIDYFDSYSYEFDGEKYSGPSANPQIQAPGKYRDLVAYVPDESLEEYQKVWKQPEGKTNWPFKEDNIKKISELNP